MAIPVVLGVVAAAQAVSALMQYYQSEKARKATNSRLKEIEAMFDAIVPPELDLKVYDDPRLAADIPAAQLDTSAITPEMYEQVGQYVPEMAEFVQEQNPQLVEATGAARTGRRAQLDALERYKQIASGEFDPELQQMLSEASQRANIDAQSRADSILQDAQRRGQFGSGIMLASQQNAAAEAMARQARESQMAAAEGYRNRLMALDKSADLGGDIRQSEMSEEARNVGILNDFNERTSRNYQDYLQSRADSLNKAKIMETERARQVADANVALKNRGAEQSRDLRNKQQIMNYEAAQTDRANRLDLEERKKKTQQQLYENLMQKASGRAGIARTGIDYLQSNAQERNAMTRGAADAVTAGAMYYGQPQQSKYPRPTSSYYAGPSSYEQDDETLMG